MKYDLILKGTVGWWDFNSDQVDNLLSRKEGQAVHVLIDSLGGLLSEGLSISSAFASHGNVHVHFRGMNASAATVASMGARRVTMDRSAMYLVHKSSYPILEWDSLNADALKAKAEEYMRRASDLEKMDCNIAMMYAGRCKKDVRDLAALMAEDRWLNSAEAVEWGFADEVTEDGAPVCLKASTATAMASAGIPVPENMPVEADGFLARMEQMLQRFFGKTGSAAREHAVTDSEDQEHASTNSAAENTMKKTYLKIAAALGMEQAEMESDADGFFVFDEGQTDALEQALSAKDALLAERDRTLADLQAAVERQQQAIAALQAKPEDEPEPVRAQADTDPAGDPLEAMHAAMRNAREMYEMLSK